MGEKGVKSKIDIWLILTNHYFHSQNLSVKNGENNGLLACVSFLSPSRAQIALSPSPFNVCHVASYEGDKCAGNELLAVKILS